VGFDGKVAEKKKKKQTKGWVLARGAGEKGVKRNKRGKGFVEAESRMFQGKQEWG